jgi:hypothetical protein
MKLVKLVVSAVVLTLVVTGAAKAQESLLNGIEMLPPSDSITEKAIAPASDGKTYSEKAAVPEKKATASIKKVSKKNAQKTTKTVSKKKAQKQVGAKVHSKKAKAKKKA